MKKYEKLIQTLGTLDTERINPRSQDIDRLSARKIVGVINEEDKRVALAVEKQLDAIARAAEWFAGVLANKGRIFYIGAGTSGRLGVLDAAECPPTFGTDPLSIIGVIAGGYKTLVLSEEGVEDKVDAAVEDLTRHGLTADDMVIGIAASRRTPYTLSGLRHAHETGCKTVYIICNRWDDGMIDFPIDLVIPLEVGPEVITGSTRMKSGTAQKMTLNLISTTAMVLSGKTFGNLMVDLKATSEKLAARSRKILVDLLAVDIDAAEKLLTEAKGSVKAALVMGMFSCTYEEAQIKLAAVGGLMYKLNEVRNE